MIKLKQFTAALSIGVCFLLAGSMSAKAAGVWHSFTYANSGETVFSPDIYQVEQVVYGAQLAEDALVGAQDLCFDAAGDLYLLDAEQKSVIITDAELRLKKHITAFSKEGEDSPLLNPTGMFVDRQKRIYICDGGNRRIIRTDQNGVIDLEITKPQADYFPQSVEFIPKKIILDSAGNLYVSAVGISDGMVMFNPDGAFIGFYGSPKVASTLELLADYFWRQFMTDEQKETMANYVPPEVTNFCITKDDFVVTITNSYWNTDGVTKMEMDDISILNPKGMNVLRFDTGKNPGRAISEDAKRLNFVAVCTDSDGFMTFIDNRQGKIYQFDQRMNLIAAFGAIGGQEGTYRLPTAIAAFGNRLYVLDADSGAVTVLSLTEYGQTIHSAISVYNTEKQSEVIGPWQEVLKLNANYDLAYVGIGNVLLNQGDYRQAMQYFELGNDSSRYNAAFKQMRLIFLRENLVLILAGVVLVLIAAGALKRLRRRRPLKLGSEAIKHNSKYTMPFSIPMHPFSGFEDLKYKNLASFKMSVILFLAFALLNVFRLQFMGKQFQIVEQSEINLPLSLLSSFLIVFIWTLSNWCFCVLIEGKATLKKIWMVSAYALVPYTAAEYLNIILGLVLTQEEGVFRSFITVVGFLWSLMMMIAAFVNFHEFEFSKAVVSIVLTVIGMVVIAVLIFLVYSLFQQLVSNLMVLMNEIIFRVKLAG